MKAYNLVKMIILILVVINTSNSIQAQESCNDTDEVLGFRLLNKLPGLWHGPVSSTTPAGNFPDWYVDFRPISAGQVSQYSLLDAQTVNNLSFFIVKHNNGKKVAMRTEGCFDNKCCITYEVVDSVNEARGYYRFSDFQSGIKRAYTEFTFGEDEFVMEVYTNKFNTKEKLELHTRWKAKLGDKMASQEAIDHFNFPQPVAIKDFSNAFEGMTESIFFTFEKDPYKSEEQPYSGSVTVNISISNDLPVDNDHELFLLLTTESMFEGLKLKKEYYKYFSKYVYLPMDTKSYTIKNVHPGKYYLYSYNDINGDKKHKKGDYMSSDIKNIITVIADENTTANTVIDFVIP